MINKLLKKIHYALITTFLLLIISNCAKRDNPHDPLSPLYSNLAPELLVKIRYDSLLAIKPLQQDTHFVMVYSEIRVVIEASDDYMKYGVPSISWILSHEKEDTIKIDSDDKFWFVPTIEGQYTLSIKAIDNEGLVYNQVVLFIASRPSHQSSLKGYTMSVNSDSMTVPVNINFSILMPDSLKSESAMVLDFGDGQYSTTRYISKNHFYSAAGTYIVTTWLRLPNNLNVTFVDTLTLRRSRSAKWPYWLHDIKVTPTPVTQNDTVQFQVVVDSSLESLPLVRWYINNSEKPIYGILVKKVFPVAGNYSGWVLIEHQNEQPISESIQILVKQSQ